MRQEHNVQKKVTNDLFTVSVNFHPNSIVWISVLHVKREMMRKQDKYGDVTFPSSAAI
jgi:hypothetical protein